MRTEGKYMLCTISELANFLAANIDLNEPLRSRFRECDFALLYEAPEDTESLAVIQTGVTGWYGIKVVHNLGFDSDSMILVTDYYGGGCATFCPIWADSGGYLNPKDALEDMILHSMEVQENVQADSLVFVELKRYVKGTGLPA